VQPIGLRHTRASLCPCRQWEPSSAFLLGVVGSFFTLLCLTNFALVELIHSLAESGEEWTCLCTCVCVYTGSLNVVTWSQISSGTMSSNAKLGDLSRTDWRHKARRGTDFCLVSPHAGCLPLTALWSPGLVPVLWVMVPSACSHHAAQDVG
jgi:hypothetical protein